MKDITNLSAQDKGYLIGQLTLATSGNIQFKELIDNIAEYLDFTEEEKKKPKEFIVKMITKFTSKNSFMKTVIESVIKNSDRLSELSKALNMEESEIVDNLKKLENN